MLVQIKNSTCKLKIVHDYYCPRMDFVLFGKVFKFYYTLTFFLKKFNNQNINKPFVVVCELVDLTLPVFGFS